MPASDLGHHHPVAGSAPSLPGLWHAENRVYAALIEQVPGILYVAETGMQGRWLYVSPQVEALLGWTPEEWLGDPTLWARCIHPDDRWIEEQAELPDQTLPGQQHTSEYRMITRAGQVRWFRDEATLIADDNGRLWAWSGVLTDITAQKQTEDRLRRSEGLSRAIIETAMDAYVAIDAAGFVRDWNRTAAQMFGWEREEILGRSLTETIIPERYREAHARGLARALAGPATDTPVIGRILELSALRRDGAELPVELTVWRTPEGEGTLFSAFLRDITERKTLQNQLLHEAHHDSLTGLANRALFHRRVAEEMADPEPRGIAVLLVDLDDFKVVNDSLGHAAGDTLLQVVADRLRSCVPASDTLARLAGDEFALLLVDVATPEDARRIAQGLHACLRPPAVLEGKEVALRASMGLRHRAAGATTPVQEMLADADVAMYSAKRQGQNGLAVFEQAMRADLERRRQLTAALQQAVSRDEVSVQYQPYVCLADQRVLGVEALARWNNPEHGRVTPGEFVPLAEDTGAIRSLGLFVLRQACADIARLRLARAEYRDLGVSVNVSARQLVDGELYEELRVVLTETGLPGEALTLELTESAFVENADAVAHWLHDIRSLGVHLAVDDFGTRYASLSYLQRFPVDTLKIDRSFVRRVHQSPQEHRLTGAIISMAQTLGLRTIAEGIEEAGHAEHLVGLGCELGQGFLFAHPLDLEHLGDFLAGHGRR
jgi:diguanylate cyclase (GGDEF)-like protein/PAS domain S-box-containing protein